MMNKNHLKKYCHSRVNGNLKYENTLPVIARIPNDEVDRETKQSANLFAAFFERKESGRKSRRDPFGKTFAKSKYVILKWNEYYGFDEILV
jgi:hypothetical protein